jgi:hypothetical protein
VLKDGGANGVLCFGYGRELMLANEFEHRTPEQEIE